ncbi:MAG TPA: histidine phosphatase family protein [Phycisphaerales bacterium]|jgi:broad specificity phosphatase PhoE|nr:histidine phosphatase family protein [Phycisphaerales bacterium]
MAKRSSITLMLIRCGETTWDAQGRVHGATDLPLSEGGRAAVMAEVQRLGGARSTIIHHPQDEAAADTARLCAMAGEKLRDVAELADPNLGLLEGLTEQEFAERFRSRSKQWKDDPITLSPPEGEDVSAAAGRIMRAVAKIIRKSRGESVAIVLHNLGWSMLRCWIAEKPLSSMRSMEDGPIIERVIIPLSMMDSLEKAADGLVTA